MTTEGHMKATLEKKRGLYLLRIYADDKLYAIYVVNSFKVLKQNETTKTKKEVETGKRLTINE